MLIATSTTSDENNCHTFIPSRARDLGRWGELPHPRCFAAVAGSA